MQARAEEEVIPQEDFTISEEQEGAQQFDLPPEMFQQQKPFSELSEEEKAERRAQRLKESQARDDMKYKLTACLALVRSYYSKNEVSEESFLHLKGNDSRVYRSSSNHFKRFSAQ